MDGLMRFPDAVRRAPEITAWFNEHDNELGSIARCWFNVIRECGSDVREILHDGRPTACVTDAAFAYVNSFTAHVNVGFFNGVELPDPDALLHGSGKYMRHVKIRPEIDVDNMALTQLIHEAYQNMKLRLAGEDRNLN